MSKLKPTKKLKPVVHKPKKITVGELVYRQMEEERAKWDSVLQTQQPYFKAAQDALEKVRLIGVALNNQPHLWESLRKAAEIERQLTEPMKKLAEPMRQLNEHLDKLKDIGTFSLSPALTEMVKNISKLPVAEMIPQNTREVEILPEITYTVPPIVTLKNQVSRLEAKLEDINEQFEQTFSEKFDKFIEKSKLPVGIKNANCHCPHCGHLIMKVDEMSYFMKATMKCGKCDKLLNVPADLVIKVDKD